MEVRVDVVALLRHRAAGGAEGLHHRPRLGVLVEDAVGRAVHAVARAGSGVGVDARPRAQTLQVERRDGTAAEVLARVVAGGRHLRREGLGEALARGVVIELGVHVGEVRAERGLHGIEERLHRGRTADLLDQCHVPRRSPDVARRGVRAGLLGGGPQGHEGGCPAHMAASALALHSPAMPRTRTPPNIRVIAIMVSLPVSFAPHGRHRAPRHREGVVGPDATWALCAKNTRMPKHEHVAPTEPDARRRRHKLARAARGHNDAATRWCERIAKSKRAAARARSLSTRGRQVSTSSRRPGLPFPNNRLCGACALVRRLPLHVLDHRIA